MFDLNDRVNRINRIGVNVLMCLVICGYFVYTNVCFCKFFFFGFVFTRFSIKNKTGVVNDYGITPIYRFV